jgi:hypothetical protein
MVRVRNEEEFLRASVESIVDLVDEVVLVDNLSTDATPSIIEALVREHPGKVVSCRYPFPVRRVGSETWDLATSRSGRRSPHLSATYYNWCLTRCAKPYVLKWDGDMIATSVLARSLAAWRGSSKPVLMIHGANLHPDLEHLLAARSSDRERLLATLELKRMPRWVTSLTHDASEPRLFPRRFARYDTQLGWTQKLESPYCDARFAAELRHVVDEPSFLHLKFVKYDPLSNYSADLARVIRENMDVGAPLDAEAREIVHRLVRPAASACVAW